MPQSTNLLLRQTTTRCKHAACDVAFVLQMHVTQREELVGGRPRHQVHEEREVARLRQSSLAAVAHVHRQERADAVGVRCLQEEAPHVGVPGSSSSEESRLEHSDADGKAELELVRRRLAKTSRSAAATKRELRRNARNGPLMRHGPDWARRTSPGILSRRAVRLKPGRKPNRTSRRASSLPGVGAPWQFLSSDLRTTTVRTTHDAEH